MQGRNGDENVENGLTDTVGEGESSSSGKSSINIYTLSCVKWIASREQMHSTELIFTLCDDLEGGLAGLGRRVTKEGI